MHISFVTTPTAAVVDLLADLWTRLFTALPDTLRLETVQVAETAFHATMTSTSATATCPDCGRLATRIHSCYDRTLADLPWAATPVRIRLAVQRFFCDQADCQRTTFTERLPTLAPPYARRTLRQTTELTQIGLALGGCAGARQATRQGMPSSRNTLLRLVRRIPPPPECAPTVIGVDDWARRKGQTYGSIVVDLERHQVLALLADRSAETVETWLHEHPTVTIISRDRSSAYAAGATAGAPDAIQVADRFHILKNLREAIEQELQRQGIVVQRTVAQSDSSAAPEPGGTDVSGAFEEHSDSQAPPPAHSAPASAQDARNDRAPSTIYADTPSGRRAEAARQERRAERVAQYTQMVELQQQGMDQGAIARAIGVSRRTVSRWSSGGQFPERKRRTGDVSRLDPYKAYLLDCWQAGCDSVAHLWRDIQAQGFQGSYRLVYEYLAPLRRGEPVYLPHAETPASAQEATQPTCYTARQLSFLMLRQEEELSETERRDLAQLQHEQGDAGALYCLSQTFAQMMRERAVECLDRWLEEAEKNPFPELQSFVAGIRRDEAAVRAALELPWSQGQVEGQITKLKLLKRQMYGRAKLDLLQQRLLHAA